MASDVYWRATQTMLDQAFTSAQVRRPGSRPRVPCGCSPRGVHHGAEGNFQAVPPDAMPDFRRLVWQRYQGQCEWQTPTEFKEQLQLLGRLNDFLEHAVLEHRTAGRAVEEPLAAGVLCRPVDQLLRLRGGSRLARGFRLPAERRADGRAGMGLAVCRPDAPGGPLAGPLDRLDGAAVPPGDGTPEGTRRSSEMLYRSWPAMQAYAVSGGEAGRLAQAALAGFLGEFPDQIRSGRRGPEQRAIAEALLAEFRPIPPVANSPDALRFRRGSPETEKDRSPDEVLHETSVDAAFELACYQVTNEQYELFDPAHRQRRDEYSQEDRCPVIYVSWYDAWAFCRWLGPSTGCRRTRNGNSPAGRAPGRRFTTGRACRRDKPISTATIRTEARRKARTWTNDARRLLQAQRLGPVRHARQCLGVVRFVVRRRPASASTTRNSSVPPVCCVAARGTTMPTGCVLRTASFRPAGSGYFSGFRVARALRKS